MMKVLPWQYNRDIIASTTPSLRYSGEKPFSEWQNEARAALRKLLRLDAIKKSENTNFTVEYVKEEDEYTEYRFTLESEPGYVFPSVLRVPRGKAGKLPTIVCLQGHSTGFHISLGKPIFERDIKSIQGGDRDFCVRAIKEGFACVAVEMRNFGECGGLETGGPDCHVSSMNAIINGRTTIGERVHDISTVIDALIENFDFVDTDRIMCMGNSGGGTATFYAAAIDERISLAMPSCAVCTYKDSIAAMKHCVCNFIPDIANYFDMGDIGGLIAPRKLVVVNGIADDIFPDAGVRESFDIIKSLYSAAGVPDYCALVTGPEGHRFYADAAWPVLHELEAK
ncbi:MAG: acetylxylan esterase [Clostridia bacterium]|nr:acetylxylan esterase [Clostridia bacterium]